MKIKEIKLHNFRAFRDEIIPLNGDFTCIIGKNDTGKSTIFAALDWFFSDKEASKFDLNIDCIDTNELYVEIIFSDIMIYEDNNLISNFQFDVDRKDNDNKHYSFKCDTNFLKKVNIMVRKDYDNHYLISIFNELGNGYIDGNTSYYQLDNMFQKLYDSYRKGDCNLTIKNKRQLEKYEFDAMIKECGLKLPQFKCFSPSHPLNDYLNLLFRVRFYHNDFDKNITDTKSNITSDINAKMQTKYPNTECYFETIMSQIDFFPLEDFMLKSNDSSLKNIPLGNRGEGFQWEIKNAVCRLLAESVSSGNENNYIFAFEEPETHLHPRAQLEMYNTIRDLSTNSNYQILITTHSPFIVNELSNDSKKQIIIVERNEHKNESKINNTVKKPVLFYNSMNENNYIAFDEPSIAYHIELFGYIHSKLVYKFNHDSTFKTNWNATMTKPNINGDQKIVPITSIKGVDVWFEKCCSANKYRWFETDNYGEERRTLPYCVRNNIDHPLKTDDTSKINGHKAFINNNKYFKQCIIKKSIELMRNAIINNPDIFN